MSLGCTMGKINLMANKLKPLLIILFKEIVPLLLFLYVLYLLVVAVKQNSKYNFLFYIAIISIIAIVGFVIFSIKKLNYGKIQVLKSIGISLLITMGIEIIFFLIGFFTGSLSGTCKEGGYCPGPFKTFLLFMPYTATAVFLITILIYYIVKLIKNK